jgi:hypothetical protein
VRINGVEFKLHKHILKLRSGYFRSLFDFEDNAGGKQEVIAVDLPGRAANSSEIARLVVRHMYELLPDFSPLGDAKLYPPFLEAVNFLDIPDFDVHTAAAHLAGENKSPLNLQLDSYNRYDGISLKVHYSYVTGRTFVKAEHPVLPQVTSRKDNELREARLSSEVRDKFTEWINKMVHEVFGLTAEKFEIKDADVVMLEWTVDPGDWSYANSYAERRVRGLILDGEYFSGTTWAKDLALFVFRRLIPHAFPAAGEQ